MIQPLRTPSQPSSPTRPSQASVVAELRGARKRYGEVTALDDVSLTLLEGEVLALLGPNGAGKTTALGLLLGLIRPSAGAVHLFGHRPQDMAARQRTGAMLQISKVPETLTVREHLTLISSYYPRPLPVAESIALAGLEGLEGRLFGKLSGGQQQRLLFALAICGDPDLLFLDEPTVGLDVEARHTFWQCIRRLVDAGRTVLLTTHHLEEADALATRVAVLDHGRVVAAGTPEDIKARAHGRRIRCCTRLPVATLAHWPGVEAADAEGGVTALRVGRAEPVVRRLLDEDPDLSDLEVKSAGLEEAMLSLTGSTATDEEVAA